MNEKPENLLESSIEENKTKPFRLSRISRLLVYFIFLLIHILNCSDGGITNATSIEIQKQLEISSTEFGSYGSIVSIGRIIGTLIVMLFLTIFNRKYVIFLALFFKCFSYFVYLSTTKYLIRMTFLFFLGVMHVFTYVYFPAWVEQFGLQKFKTLMTSSFIQMASPVGNAFGFIFSTFLGVKNWRLAFASLALCILFLDFILLFIPNKFFSKSLFYANEIKNDDNNSSFFEYDEEKVKKKEKEKKIFNKNKYSKWLLLLKPAFVTVVFSRCILMFCFTCFQFWLGAYYTNGLHLNHEKTKIQKSISYFILYMISPTLGSTVGSFFCEKIGGCTKKKSSLLCMFFAICAGISAIFLTIPDNAYIFSFIMFCFFFFGNCMIPTLIGIGFNCVGKKEKIAAYGVNSLMCVLFGNLPAPTVYGFINDKFKDVNSRMAMRICINYIWVSVILLSINYFVRSDDVQKEIDGIDVELEDVDNGNEA